MVWNGDEVEMDHVEWVSLPGTQEERRWIEKRLETLSGKESIILSAAVMRQPPKTMRDAIHHLASLEDYRICFPAGSYAQLGNFYLQHAGHLPERAFYYVDLDRVGMMYEDQHPGLFIGNCYVVYPIDLSSNCFAERDEPLPTDEGWSVKVKLGSPANPEGVWLRLPDHSLINDGKPDELDIALHELRVDSLEDCILMDARCCIPQLDELMEQYADAQELVSIGNDLGYALEEQGQGMPHFTERFAAALEFEHCRDLRLALDISQNLHCYEWVPCDGLKEYGRRKLLEAGVSEELVDSGCIDLEGYGADLLEGAGYVLTADESAYIARNNMEFLYEWSSPEGVGMTLQ